MPDNVVPDWKPSASLKQLRFRAELLDSIRNYFKQEEVLEIEAPILSQSANVDPFIESFSTEFRPIGSVNKSVSKQTTELAFLHTSPEFALKRLLVAGMGNLYSMGKVFRNGEIGGKHNPEFTLLEWYRLGVDHHALMDDVSKFLGSLSDFKEINRYTYQDLFEKHLGVNPHEASLQELQHCVYECMDIYMENIPYNTCLELLFSKKIEPWLKNESKGGFSGVFVYDYPKSMVALSRLMDSDKNQKVAARFELFCNGMELANGYYELTDSDEQHKRFQQDNVIRSEMGLPVYPCDKLLVNALKQGLPDCSGVALGVDRLHMLLAGVSEIKEVIPFSFDKA